MASEFRKVQLFGLRKCRCMPGVIFVFIRVHALADNMLKEANYGRQSEMGRLSVS